MPAFGGKADISDAIPKEPKGKVIALLDVRDVARALLEAARLGACSSTDPWEQSHRLSRQAWWRATTWMLFVRSARFNRWLHSRRHPFAKSIELNPLLPSHGENPFT